MATTYEAIATVTVGSGGQAEIEFTSIPATYTDLVVKLSLRTTNAGTDDQIRIKINGNAAGNAYSSKFIQASGSAAVGFSGSTAGYVIAGAVNGNGTTANTFGNAELYFPNYAGSTNKSYSVDAVMENNATTAYAELAAILWSNTSAITSLAFFAPSVNLKEFSTATLYGIKNS
jgi:hypothetical protein